MGTVIDLHTSRDVHESGRNGVELRHPLQLFPTNPGCN